jgi:hypothetical protein
MKNKINIKQMVHPKGKFSDYLNYQTAEDIIFTLKHINLKEIDREFKNQWIQIYPDEFGDIKVVVTKGFEFPLSKDLSCFRPNEVLSIVIYHAISEFSYGIRKFYDLTRTEIGFFEILAEIEIWIYSNRNPLIARIMYRIFIGLLKFFDINDNLSRIVK